MKFESLKMNLQSLKRHLNIDKCQLFKGKIAKSSVSFRKNKPNFKNIKIGISSFQKSKYEILPAWRGKIQTQSKANSNPIPEWPKMNTNIYDIKAYIKKTAVRRIQTNPNKPNFILDVSSLDFLSGDKANTKHALSVVEWANSTGYTRLLLKSIAQVSLKRKFQKSVKKSGTSGIIYIKRTIQDGLCYGNYEEHGGLKTPVIRLRQQFLPRAEIIRKVSIMLVRSKETFNRIIIMSAVFICLLLPGCVATPEQYNKLGIAYNDKGEYQKAILEYNRAIKANPLYAEAFYNRGRAYGRLRQYDRAIMDFTKVLQIYPMYAEAYNNRGAAYGAKGQYEQALADFSKALEMNTRYDEAYVNRGLVYYDKGQFAQAIADYTRALAINTAFAAAYCNRGAAYNVIDEYDKAIPDFNRALAINPRYADALYNRGRAYAVKGRHDQAIADYTGAIDIDKDYAKAYYYRGRAYGAKGDYDKAIADFSKVIAINAADGGAYCNRGVAYAGKRQFDKAWEDVKKALNLGHQVPSKFLMALREASGKEG